MEPSTPVPNMNIDVVKIGIQLRSDLNEMLCTRANLGTLKSSLTDMDVQSFATKCRVRAYALDHSCFA